MKYPQFCRRHFQSHAPDKNNFQIWLQFVQTSAIIAKLALVITAPHTDVIKWKHFRVTGPLCGEFTGEFPTQRPLTRSFDVFFDLRLNKRLSKQPWGWWFETPSWSLWRHCNGIARCDFLQTGTTSVWIDGRGNRCGKCSCMHNHLCGNGEWHCEDRYVHQL